MIILLAAYNGALGLPDQLASIKAQDHANWRLIVSDDGSSDTSRDIVTEFARTAPAGAVVLLDGPCKGAAENFMSLLRTAAGHQTAPATNEHPFLAFCDQDDIWLPDRLSRGLAALSAIDPERPSLFCSRTWITDSAGVHRRLSRARPRPPSFRNALVQNIASGNTILLNPAATKLAYGAAGEITRVVVHDWWTYQLVTGAGGTVIHSDEPTLLYVNMATTLSARTIPFGPVCTAPCKCYAVIFAIGTRSTFRPFLHPANGSRQRIAISWTASISCGACP